MKGNSLEEKIKKILKKKIEKVSKKKPRTISLGISSNPDLGDFFINCYQFIDIFDKKPEEIGEILAKELSKERVFEKIKRKGGYLNFFLKKELLFKEALREIFKKKQKAKKKGKIMIEFLSPNANKPLHLGHLRNALLGEAISRIFERKGYQLIRANLINDRGIHISKTIVAYLKWEKGKTPKKEGKKGDHFVGALYVKYNQKIKKSPKLKEELENLAREILRKWERGDKEIIALWKKIRNWVLEGFAITLKRLGIRFDVVFFESKTYKLGKKIIKEGIKKGIFYQDKSRRILFDLPKKEFGVAKDGKAKKIVLLREDGTSLYITQDLGLALLKMKKGIKKSIYITGSEQKFHFKVLFTILKKLGFRWAKNLYHLPYGMVYLPEGKMKSREGKVIEIDDILEKMTKLAEKEILKREKWPQKDLKKRAEKIALSGLKFHFLKISPLEDIYFKPKESLSFEGFTGPYCLYALVRIKSILKKKRKFDFKKIDFSLLRKNEEIILARQLLRFEKEINLAFKELNPARIANYAWKLAKNFNKFYEKCPVLKEKEKSIKFARIALIKGVAKALEELLNLLGIEPVTRM